MSDKCRPYPGTPVPPCSPCPPKPGRPCPPPPPPFKPLPGGTQQYIGARYVPAFAEPIEWDINKPYESLTIVTYQGNSFTSKCAVPGGTDITNERYWAKTGDYNAQVAEYRAAVGDLSTQVTGFAKDNAEFREKIDQYDKDNAAMKNEVAASTARVNDLAKRVDTAEADIDGLQATTNQHTQKLADLEAADTQLAQSIAENDTDIANLQKKDIQHDSEISAIKTVNDQQGAAIAQNTADIAQNKKNIADNARNIAENAAEIADHAETLKVHTADLAALHRDVQDNKTAIAKNASDIVGLRADLTEAEADIAQNTDGVTHLKSDVVRIDAKDTEQDNIIGDWKNDHPGQTISECATSQENELAEHAAQIAKLETDKADKTAFDQLCHLKRPAVCVGGFSIYYTDTRANNPPILIITVPTALGSGMLKADADDLAAQLNAATHTDFSITGLARPVANDTAPLYVHCYGKITGNFEVVKGYVDENWDIVDSVGETFPFAVLKAPVTITHDVPEGYSRPQNDDILIGDETSTEGIYGKYPVFPEYLLTQ